MTPVTAHIEEQTETNLVDYIISLLNAEDDATISAHLQQLHAAEIAGLLESLPPELRQHLWKLLPQGIEGETLTYLGDEVLGSIIGEMGHAEVVAATETMDVEDLAYVMDELPEQISEAVLESLDEDRRQRLEATLSFTEGTAGRLM
ncbi:MAG: magnesium transporter MgtE N-terminal domain-containing protein, partial [Gammaproteobacteria bacterium]